MECELLQGPHSLKRWTLTLHSEVLPSDAEVAQDDWRSVHWPDVQIRSNEDFLSPLKSRKGGKISGQNQQGLGTLACRVMLEGRTHSSSHEQDKKTIHIKHSWIWGNIHLVPTAFTGHNSKLQDTKGHDHTHDVGEVNLHTTYLRTSGEEMQKSRCSEIRCGTHASDDVLLLNIMFKTFYYWLMILNQSIRIWFFW